MSRSVSAPTPDPSDFASAWERYQANLRQARYSFDHICPFAKSGGATWYRNDLTSENQFDNLHILQALEKFWTEKDQL